MRIKTKSQRLKQANKSVNQNEYFCMQTMYQTDDFRFYKTCRALCVLIVAKRRQFN